MKFLGFILVVTYIVINIMVNFCYDKQIYHETIHQGETLDTILEQYYNPAQENRTWMEFRADNYKRNEMLTLNNRKVQAGDIVCIELHIKKF